LQPVAKSVLKDRHHSPCRLFLGRDQPVDLGERAGQRLLADDLLTGCQSRQGLRAMQHRRGADVDDVDIAHAQEFVE
jgi:hypothetical protein